MPPLPGPIPRPEQVESEVARTSREEHEREWARHRDEDGLQPHRLLTWWRRLFGDPASDDARPDD
ncbi:MAG TPA: hypothetical protein VID47_05400 [Actinomycetota bacterium]|jgi:hypothetical protein